MGSNKAVLTLLLSEKQVIEDYHKKNNIKKERLTVTVT